VVIGTGISVELDVELNIQEEHNINIHHWKTPNPICHL